ncbi:TVP38/TMEM64 family protein [Adhaeribacter sp. BT258]|uniref:TVP38/TMEM64 family membrane protein n=1 Tax=Adhaeribacter terrigena TaxID=2793070 RepID=A0ABS1C6M3_9BACT|nr:TVP38/TMEM64 family protein [Adhaeribacter terrigena]MBK0404343.1 TVP38/TMEM64 family protein [Adhaeribacter terrigena]
MKPENKEKSSKLPLYITLGVVGTVFALYFFWPPFAGFLSEAWSVLKTGDQQKISAWVEQFGYWGPLVIILFMIVQMFMVVVNVLAIIIITILVYGPVWGSLIAFSGIMLASIIGYGVGRWAGVALVHKLLGVKAATKVEAQVDRYGYWAVAIARVIPVISNDAISFVAGSTGLGFWKFLGATTAGVVPLITLIAFIGNDSKSLTTGLIWLSAIGITAFLIFYFYDKHKRKTEVAPPEPGKR